VISTHRSLKEPRVEIWISLQNGRWKPVHRNWLRASLEKEIQIPLLLNFISNPKAEIGGEVLKVSAKRTKKREIK
jgi:hypothetical protein